MTPNTSRRLDAIALTDHFPLDDEKVNMVIADNIRFQAYRSPAIGDSVQVMIKTIRGPGRETCVSIRSCQFANECPHVATKWPGDAVSMGHKRCELHAG